MESFFVFILFVFVGAGIFMAGYFAHARTLKIKQQVKQFQESVTRPSVPPAPRPIYNVTIDHATPRWSTRMGHSTEEDRHFDISGAVNSRSRTVSISEGSASPYYGLYGRSYITIPAADVDEMILAMKSAQLAAQSGPEE